MAGHGGLEARLTCWAIWPNTSSGACSPRDFRGSEVLSSAFWGYFQSLHEVDIGTPKHSYKNNDAHMTL